MSFSSRREYLANIKNRYLHADRNARSAMLDEYCKNAGLKRKYIISLLSPKVSLTYKIQRQRKKRKVTYGNREAYYLKKIWEVLDYPCSQRLAPMLSLMIRKLEQFHELHTPIDVAEKLVRMAPSTIDQKLQPFRRQIRRFLHGTTKPGSLLKSQIPILTSSWQESRAGFCELDTVAHCGASAEGDFAYTVNITDILTGWTEQEAIMGKAQKRVIQGLFRLQERLPFPLRGIDPDNGSEFINWQLYGYCLAQQIEFTRGRPYERNDNAHIEQKNWTHVRKIFGYSRIAQAELVDEMNDLYRHEVRLYKNFFQPVMKLVEKKRVGEHGEKLKRRYDIPKTPYQRVMECKESSAEMKEKLRIVYEQLNPAELKRRIEEKLKKFRQDVFRQREKSEKR